MLSPLTPLPVTVSPPLVPVLLSTMPLAAPLAEMLWNVRSFAPMVVLATLSAVPVPELIVLPSLPTGHRAAAGGVEAGAAGGRDVEPVAGGMKLIVAPVLLVRLTAMLAVVTAGLAGEVDRPPVRPVT